MEWLRAGLSGLTARGRSFLAAGAAATISAFALGQRDLLRIAFLLLALPIACLVVVGRAQLRLALTRTITPLRVVAGSPARVRLELENLTRGFTQVLLAEDGIPYTLGPSPRFVLARLPGGRRAAVTYTLQTQVRGRYEIGPLRLQLSDPFGLYQLDRAFTATDPLVVVPRTWPLSGGPAGGHWGGSGEAVHGTAAASGEHDVAIREYRHGDDLRRVHWRSTARRGELMVRRDEQPRQMRATVLLDTRREGHRGEGVASSFEWAVSAAASVAVHLAGMRYAVRLLVDDPAATWVSPSGDSTTAVLLERLALARLDEASGLTGSMAALQRSRGDGVIVAVLGELDEELAGALAAMRHRGTSGVAMLLRVPEWALLPPGAVAELDAQRDRAAAVLRSAGWSVIQVSAADAVPAVWQQVVSGRFAGPVGPAPTTIIVGRPAGGLGTAAGGGR